MVFEDFYDFACLPFGWLLKPTWLHFGRVWGAKLAPSWHQIAPKIDPKNKYKNYHILDQLRTDFWWILASNFDVQGGPTNQVLEPMLALGAILGPRWPPELSKRALGPILVDFWTHFGRFLDQCCRCLDQCSMIFKHILIFVCLPCLMFGHMFACRSCLSLLLLMHRCIDA